MPILGSSGGIEKNGHKSGWITLSMLLNAYAGLQINAKTKSMATGKNTSQRPCTNHALWTSLLETIDLPIEQVNKFVYLGSTISSDGTIASMENSPQEFRKHLEHSPSSTAFETTKTL